MIFRGSIPHPMQLLCTLRNHCRQWPRNTRYQAGRYPLLGPDFHRLDRTSLLAHLFNYLVGAGEQRSWNFEAEYLSGRKVYDEIELGRLLDWEIGGVLPAQNFVDVVGRAPEQVWEVCSVGHQPPHFNRLPLGVHRRQSRRQHQGVDAKLVGSYERVDNDIKCLRAAIERLEGRHDVFASLDF